MAKNMTISKPLFSGSAKISGQIMEVDTNGLTYGFLADPAVGTGVPFGVVVQKGASANLVKAGVSAIATNNYGISVFAPAIAQSRPASPDGYIAGMPVNVMCDGYLWFYPEAGATGITRASNVIAKDATGVISFGASAGSGETVITWAKVVLVDERNKRVLVKVDISLAV